jgi:hypothetical protein
MHFDFTIGCYADAAPKSNYTPCDKRKDPTACKAIRHADHAVRQEKKKNNSAHPFTRVWRKYN